MAELRYGAALNRALADAMDGDPDVIVMGEDIAGAGGSFGVTRGLLDRFGAERVIDTPISEATIAGAAVGAAMAGLKPVFEIMFMDFATLTMDAMVNQAAKARFMFGGQCSLPIVLRTPHGGGLSAGPQHSQCLEAWFAHIPGLKVVCPSDAASAYGLLRGAIADPDPVVFVEHKGLYARKWDVSGDLVPLALGKATTLRSGRDATVVSYGAAVGLALTAADTLAAEGISLEIIDLRTLQPWDEAAVLASLARTHRLVIVHEAVEAFGIGAEIAARMADIGFDELDGPIVRVGAPFMPVPFAAGLEREYQPSAERVVAAVRKAMGREQTGKA
jgi:pyruvate dehydrogenase E1 component beta subunit